MNSSKSHNYKFILFSEFILTLASFIYVSLMFVPTSSHTPIN